MKRLLAYTSVFALALGGAALAQTSTTSPSSSSGMSSSSSTMGSGSSKSSMSSSQVKQAQTALKQQGLYNGSVDGKMGPATKSAIAQFQKKEGLPQTSSLDAATMSKLQGSSGSSSMGTSGSSSSSGLSNRGNNPSSAAGSVKGGQNAPRGMSPESSGNPGPTSPPNK